MTEKEYSYKEPIIHSHISDELHPDSELLKKLKESGNDGIYCDKCGKMLCDFNSECMETWFETDYGNYCTDCFEIKDVMCYKGDGIKEVNIPQGVSQWREEGQRLGYWEYFINTNWEKQFDEMFGDFVIPELILFGKGKIIDKKTSQDIKNFIHNIFKQEIVKEYGYVYLFKVGDEVMLPDGTIKIVSDITKNNVKLNDKKNNN